MIDWRLRTPVAGLAATLLTSATLLPSIHGNSWFVVIFVATTVVTVVGIALRGWLRPWPAVALAQLLALVWTLLLLFARDTTVWGFLPGSGSLSTLAELAHTGTQTLGRLDPPWENVRGLILLAVLASGIVGLAVDVLAVALRAPALAGLPLLALYCVPSALEPHGGDPVGFLAAGAGFLLLLSIATRDGVRDWGEVLAADRSPDEDSPPKSPLREKTRGLARIGWGARRTLLLALVLALVVPALLPGLDNKMLSSTADPAASANGDGPATIEVINPILDIRRNLTDRSDATVITYRTDAETPPPLRLVTDDVFDGVTWAPSVGSISLDQDVRAGLPSVPGLSPRTVTTERTASITVTKLDSTYLPMPYPARRATVPGTWLWDGDTFNVVGWGTDTQGLSYRVEYLEVQATDAVLAQGGPPPQNVIDRFTDLPEDLPESIPSTARRVAGTGSGPAQARRIQDWLRSTGGFTYSEILSPDGQLDSGQDAVASFLRTKTGYCVQFASTMAVMARSLGIPARVAVGFLPGERIEDGSYRIRLRDAHAWPELYFEGVGWTRFEPTPSIRTGTTPSGTPSPEVVPSAEESSSEGATPVDSGAGENSGPGADSEYSDGVEEPNTADSGPELSALTRWWTAVPWSVLGGVLLILIVLATPWAVVTIDRARRRRATVSPQERAETAWSELGDRLAELQVRWPPSWTPRTVQGWLSAEWRLSPTSAAALVRIVDDLERARYARPSTVSRPMDERSTDLREIERAVARTRPWWLRTRATAFPVATALRRFRGTTVAARERVRHR